MKLWLLVLTAIMFSFPAYGAPSYVGVWAESSDKCQAEGDIVPMEIEVSSILFYESHCDLKDIVQHGESWTAQAACSGEGETWNESIRMTVSGETMSFYQDDGEGVRYIRCP